MKNLILSFKYFLRLTLLCAAVIGAMYAADLLAAEPAQLFAMLFASWRGWVLLTAILVLAGLYPRTGFIVRRVEGDPDDDRTQLLNALAREGYALAGEEEDTLRFRVRSPLRRAWLLGDDEIRAARYGQWIELEGPRRPVAMAAYRLEGFINTKRRS